MHLIVDAFNVLHAWGRGPDSGGFSEIRALSGLIFQSRYAGGRVSIVCDGARFTGEDEPNFPHRMRILFAGGGREADPLIEKLIERDSGPRELVVASSDRRLQKAASRRRAKWFTSQAFLGQLIQDGANPGAQPSRPPFARKVPLTNSAVDYWLEEFEIEADFGGPGSLPSAPPRMPPHPPTPEAGRQKHPRQSIPKKSEPIAKNAEIPADPLLRQALEHWQGRLSLDDLDMRRWLDES
jgi:predicted RNA-binding protein with PIN domain